jgi:hypothetical protein
MDRYTFIMQRARAIIERGQQNARHDRRIVEDLLRETDAPRLPPTQPGRDAK